MNTQQLLEALDARVVTGDLVGAFDEFFSDDVLTYSDPSQPTRSKAEKAQALRWFMESMTTNRIELLSTRLNGEQETFSEFIFDFTDQQGQSHVWHEVIRRRWHNGKVVEEQYFTNLPEYNPMSELPAEPTVEAPAKPAAKTTGRKKAAEPESEATEPKPKTRKKAAAPSDTDAPQAEPAAPKKTTRRAK